VCTPYISLSFLPLPNSPDRRSAGAGLLKFSFSDCHITGHAIIKDKTHREGYYLYGTMGGDNIRHPNRKLKRVKANKVKSASEKKPSTSGSKFGIYPHFN